MFSLQMIPPFFQKVLQIATLKSDRDSPLHILRQTIVEYAALNLILLHSLLGPITKTLYGNGLFFNPIPFYESWHIIQFTPLGEASENV